MAYTTQDIQGYLQANPGMTDAQIAAAMDQYGITPEQMAAATGLSTTDVQSRYNVANPSGSYYTAPTQFTQSTQEPQVTWQNQQYQQPLAPQEPQVTWQNQQYQPLAAQEPQVTWQNQQYQQPLAPQEPQVTWQNQQYQPLAAQQNAFSTAASNPVATPSVSPQSQVDTQAGVADYLRPYVDTMLGATQQQLFNYDAEGNVTGMKGYTPYSLNPADYVAGFTPLQEQSFQGIAALQNPWQTGAASTAMQSAMDRAANLGYNPIATSFDRVASQNIVAPEMQAAQTNYNPTLEQYQMGPAERIGEPGSITAQNALQAYMSPYMQNVVDVQQQQAKRQAAIAQQLLGAQAAKAGAFGGSGAALQRAQANADLQRNLQGIQATGLQTAFQNAQQQFNTEQQARMQAAMANQQAGLQVGSQNLAAKLGVQQLGTQTGLQAALANLSAQQQAAVQNQASKLQAAGMNATQALQAAIANQQAQQQANQLAVNQQQFGANYGLQGLQAAMSGASQLGALGTSGLQNQLGVLGAQQQAGGLQQQQQQQVINQGVQNYNTAQQYPYMQLGFMQNMLGGLPIATSSQQTYQAAPSTISQLAGLGIAGLGLNSLLGKSSGTGGTNTGDTNTGGGWTDLLNGVGGGIADAASSVWGGVKDLGSLWSSGFGGGYYAKGGTVSSEPQGLAALAISKM